MINKEIQLSLLKMAEECKKCIDARILELNQLDYNDNNLIMEKYKEMSEEKNDILNIYYCVIRCKMVESNEKIKEFKNKYLEYDNKIKKMYYMYMFHNQ